MRSGIALRAAIACALSGVVAQDLYRAKSDVLTVRDSQSFRKEVLEHPGVVVVEFYAPWCGHCQALKPEYEKAAQHLAGIAKVVAVDASGEPGQAVAAPYGVQGFPSIKVFGADKAKPAAYEGPRTADGISDAALKAIRATLKTRKAGGGSGGGAQREASPKRPGGKGKASAVVTATEANFEEEVLQSADLVLVEFFAPWCGHCKALAPEWEAAAEQLKDQDIKLVAVDATADEGLARKYRVEGYPTIKVFPPGDKLEPPTDYQGPREAAGIQAYALQLQEQSGVEPSIPQVLKASDITSKCTGKRICVLAVLPHILDSGAAGRNEYINMLVEVARSNRGSPFRFFWSEGGAQTGVEEAFEMSFGFPALAAFSLDKNAFALQRGAFSRESINAFLLGVLSGREAVGPVPSGAIPAFADAMAWDGEDASAAEEEFSLEDLGLEL